MNREFTDALGWALIHFLWQGVAIALLAGLANAVLRRASANARYVVSCGALVLMLIVPAVTFLAIYSEGQSNPVVLTAPAPMERAAAGQTTKPVAAEPEMPAYLPVLVQIWLCGVALLSLRSFGGWVIAQRLKRRKVTTANETVQRAARRLAARLAIRRTVRVFESAVAEVPGVIGWLRPVILMPASAVTAMSPEQIELLVAHELAHIRRYDYLVNLIQTAVETVLFYHPAVWWVSAQIRAEREHCCDDLAVQACGDAVAYVRTLAALEGLRSRQLGLAVAADGGSLLARIQRLAKGDRVRRRHTPPAWIGAVIPVAVVLLAFFAVQPKPVSAVDTSQGSGVPANNGYLAGLTAAGYTSISVDEIIALKENSVDPRFIKEMTAAGLGVPTPAELIKLRHNGVEPDFAARVVDSKLVRELSFEALVPLRQNGVDPRDMARVRALGFGPFPVEQVVKMRQHGVTSRDFETLKEAGVKDGGLDEALRVQQNGLSADRVRSMKNQGFSNLTLDQMIKLRRAGII